MRPQPARVNEPVKPAAPVAVVPEVPKPSPADWENARQIYQQDQIISMLVVGFNRGGLLVEGQGLQGFVPYSHLVEMNDHTDSDRDVFLDKFVGKQLKVKIIECVPEEGRIVYSERAARAESGCRNRLFTGLKVGQCINGEVTNITDFGVFVDLGGVEGLIHISELSWGRVEHPAQIASLGEKLAVQVLDISPERCRVALSVKRLAPNPWETVDQRYAVNDIVPAIITTVVSFGAFARLEDGLEGLVHVTEINLPAGKMVKDIYSTGQKVHVRILQVDAAHQRLGLSLKLES
jgi:small subunit ribosomal protein S1